MTMDFDEARRIREETDRSIRIGGHVFTYKAAVAPEVIVRWNQAATGELELSEPEWLKLFDETILAILDPGQEDAWAAVRDPAAAHPLNLTDLREVLRYLIEQATGRPTTPPSGSSPGGDSTETTSTVASSSPAVAPSPPSTPGAPST